MAKYIGVDWAGRGWLGVVLRDNGDWGTDVFPSLSSLWKYHSDAERILVGVPIGLPEEGRRACDIVARRRLGAAHRSVFYTPTREAVYAQGLAAAKAANEDAGFSIQSQAWSLVVRIREVDEFLDRHPGARDRLFETHPEVCFHALNGGSPVRSGRTTRAGHDRRRTIVADAHPDAMDVYETAVERYTEPEYAPMIDDRADVLDALVAAITAQRRPPRLSALPEAGETPRDARGLPMEILFPADTQQTRLTSLDVHR